MKTWLRSTGAQNCGSCDRKVPAGRPVQEIYLPELHNMAMQKRYRCAECALDAVPVDIAALPEAQASAPELMSVSAQARIGLGRESGPLEPTDPPASLYDARQRQTGETS